MKLFFIIKLKELVLQIKIKKMRPIKLIFFISLFSFSISFSAQNGLDLLIKMLEKGITIKTLAYNMRMKERIKDKYAIAKNFFKIQVNPCRVYLKQEYPLTDMEILYVDGINGNQVLVHPSGFPWTNVNLDPNSLHMRKNLHHPIMDSGFNYVFSIIKYIITKYEANAQKMVTYDGNITWKGVLCYKLKLTNPNFKYQDYTVKPGETFFSIAQKNKINDYMILDKNPSIENFDACKPGMKLKLPVDYASKMELWVDQKNMTPVVMRIYDDVGLYEEFEFSNVVINCKFQANEFTKDFSGYHF